MTDLRAAAQRLLTAIDVALPHAPPLGEFDCVSDAAADLRAALAASVSENEALRADAERYRWLLEYLIRHQLLVEMLCTPGQGEQTDYWWVLWPSYAVDQAKAPLGYATTPDAAIDAAKERT